MNIKFFEPVNFKEAAALLAEYGDDAKIIAGGTAMVLMLRQKLISPAVLVSLGRIQTDSDPSEIAPIPEQGASSSRDAALVPPVIRKALAPVVKQGNLHLGALTSLRLVEQSSVVRQFCPALAHSYSVVGNIRIRNQATVGGNLAEADYASDPPSMLLALNARVGLMQPNSTRELPFSEFTLGFYTTALESAEIVTDVIIPPLSERAKTSYHKFSSRSAEDRPCVVVAALVELDPDGRCTDLRVAVGAAIEIPQRLKQVESSAIGQKLNDDLIASIGDEYAHQLDPLSDVRGSAWYRREMISVIVRRSLTALKLV